MLSFSRLAVLAFGLFFAFESFAVDETAPPDPDPLKDLEKLVTVDEEVATLTTDLMGDTVDLYSGALSLRQTDVTVRTNIGHTLSVSRSFDVGISTGERDNGRRKEFGDWWLDVPRVTRLAVDPNVTDEFGNPTGWPESQCSDTSTPPPVEVNFGTKGYKWWDGELYWKGDHLHLPGQGSGELLVPTQDFPDAMVTGGFSRITKGNAGVKCYSNSDGVDANGNSLNHTGEGFKVFAPDGKVYYLEHLRYYNATMLRGGTSTAGTAAPLPYEGQLVRVTAAMLVTRIELPGGGYVKYEYDANGRLARIVASSGEQITLSYNSDNTVSRIAADGEEWTYSYNQELLNPTLSGITRPDGSSWEFDMTGLASLAIGYAKPDPVEDPLPPCWLPQTSVAPESGSIKHPSGALVEFTVGLVRHGWAGVPSRCEIESALAMAKEYHTLSLFSKTLTGPGIDYMSWSYSYNNPPGWMAEDPPGAETKSISITDPEGVRTVHEYSMKFDKTEGDRLKTSIYAPGASSPIREILYTAYDHDSRTIGISYQGLSNVQRSGRHVLEKEVVISEGGNDFMTEYQTHDAFGNPTSIRESNTTLPMGSPPTTKTRTYTYEQKYPVSGNGGWIVGLPESTSIDTTECAPLNLFSCTIVERTYDDSGRLLTVSSFGNKLYDLDWHQYSVAGHANLKSVTRRFGGGNPDLVTSYESYVRGIPEKITNPDGSFRTITVNGNGTIASITDERSNTTSYQYDEMKRLVLIDYPRLGRSNRQISFNPINATEYGVEAGHWKQVITEGGYKKSLVFDGLYRPVVSVEEDTSWSGSLRVTRKEFNSRNQELFVSYPKSSFAAATLGTHHEYDALGRPVKTRQDSEIGNLDTSISYSNGFRKTVTDPSSFTTTFEAQTFGSPGFDAITRIEAPEGQTTVLTRDSLGRLLSASRTNAANASESVTRNYFYNDLARLCRVFDPESHSTITKYHPGGQAHWVASGVTGSLSGCSYSAVDASNDEATVMTYDNAGRVINEDVAYGGDDISRVYDPAGNLETLATGNSIWNYTYNESNLVDTATLSVGMDTYTLSRSYNARDALASLTYPSGRTVTFNPNGFAEPTRVEYYATQISYHPNGMPASYVLVDGTRRDVMLNTRQMPSSIEDSNGYFHDVLSYDARGNLSGLTDYATALGSSRTLSQFSYDGLSRLTSVNAETFGTINYEYDALDNLRRTDYLGDSTDVEHPEYQTPSSLVYEYDWNRHVLMGIHDGASSPTYLQQLTWDDRGNVSSRNGTAFDFDHANRLESISGKSSYSYDGHGRRVRKTETGGSTKHYVYDTSGLLLHVVDKTAGTYEDNIYLGRQLIATTRSSSVAPDSSGNIQAETLSHDGSVDVSWEQNNYALEYRVTREAQESQMASKSWTFGPGNHSFTDSSLEPGGYQYTLEVCNNSGCAAAVQSNVAGVTPPAPAAIEVPLAPSYTGSFSVSWPSVSGADNYKLERKTDSGEFVELTTTGNTSYTETALPAAGYTYRITSCNGYGCNTNKRTSAEVGVIPLTPTNVSSPATDKDGNFDVTWTASVGADHYEIDRREANGTWAKLANEPSAPSLSQSGMAPGGWEYRIRACNEFGCSASSALTLTGVLPPSPTVSAVLGQQVIDEWEINVSWSNPVGAETYEVEQQYNGGSWFNYYSGTENSQNILEGKGGEYRYRGRACNSYGCSDPALSNIISLAPNDLVFSITASKVGSAGIDLTWDNGASGADTFTVTQSFDGGAFAEIYSGSGMSLSLTGLSPGQYQFKAQGCNSAGCTSYKSSDVVDILPSIPASISVPASGTDQSFSVSWASVSSATSYTLQQKFGTGSWQTVYTGSNTTRSLNVNSGGDYTYRVKACTSTVCSSYRTSAVVGVLPAPPAISAMLGDMVVDEQQVDVSWNAPAGANRLDVDRVRVGESWMFLYDSDENTTSASLLVSKGGDYKFRARACNSHGCTGFVESNTVSIAPNDTQLLISATKVGSTGIDLSWDNGASGATSFTVRQTVNGGTASTIYSGPNMALSLTGLNPGTYVFSVQGCNSAGCTSYKSSNSVDIIPAIPASISVPASGTDQSFSVSWASVSNATSYTLQQKFGTGSWQTIYTGSGTSRSLNVNSGGDYTYRVKACANSVCSSYRTSAVVGVLPAPPAISAALGDMVLDEQEININWNAPAGANRLDVDRLRVGESWMFLYDGDVSTTSSRYLASKGGDYKYRARACNSHGCSSFNESNTVSIAPNDTLFSVSASKVGSNGIDVSWDQQLSGASSFTVQQQLNSGSWSTVYSGGNRTLSLTSLAAGEYRYRAQGCNGAGCTTYKYSGTIEIQPATPASISTPSTDTNQSFGVSWTASTGANSYTLQQQFNSGSWSTVYTGSNTSRTVSVSSGGDYRYRVKACMNTACSSYRTSGTTVVAAPRPGSINSPGTDSDGSFTVSWSSSSGATSYNLQRRKNGGSWSQIYSGSSTSKSQSGLGQGTWDYRVRACHDSVCSAWRSYTRTVVEYPPSSVSVSSPSTSMDGNYTVSWTASSGATSYTLQESVLSGNTWGSFQTVQTGSSRSKSYTYKPDGNYRYRARACKTYSCSGWSNISYTEVGTGFGCLSSSEPTLMSDTSSSTDSDADSKSGKSQGNGKGQGGKQSTDGGVSTLAGPGC